MNDELNARRLFADFVCSRCFSCKHFVLTKSVNLEVNAAFTWLCSVYAKEQHNEFFPLPWEKNCSQFSLILLN